MLLCLPFNKKDYNKEDPFIYKVLLVLNHKTCRIKCTLMIGKLGGKYVNGDELCANSCTTTVNHDKILAIMNWDLQKEMPKSIAEKIREIY